jgi:hypothetical protein
MRHGCARLGLGSPEACRTRTSPTCNGTSAGTSPSMLGRLPLAARPMLWPNRRSASNAERVSGEASTSRSSACRRIVVRSRRASVPPESPCSRSQSNPAQSSASFPTASARLTHWRTNSGSSPCRTSLSASGGTENQVGLPSDRRVTSLSANFKTASLPQAARRCAVLSNSLSSGMLESNRP